MSNEPVTEPIYLDRPEVQETYVDQVRLTHFDGHSVRLEFTVNRPQLAGPNRAEVRTYPAARLVLAPQVAINLKEQLEQLLTLLEQQGVLRRMVPSTSSKQ